MRAEKIQTEPDRHNELSLIQVNNKSNYSQVREMTLRMCARPTKATIRQAVVPVKVMMKEMCKLLP